MLSDHREKQIKKFLESAQITSADLELFDEALTHPSYNFENNINAKDYERLEFLGDSVLRLAVSTYLFDKYKDYDEGNLTKIRSYLVSDEFLYMTALDFKLDKLLNIGCHEEKDGGRKKESIVACAMEAVFGALYKSAGFDAALNFIFRIYDNKALNVKDILYSYNSKEILQQYTQAQNKDLPEYILINESGKAHNKTYEVSVNYHGEELGRGVAKTKKEAEKLAAFDAIKSLKLIKGVLNE